VTLAPLSFDDTVPVLERLAEVPAIVLVGGQALNFWCVEYAEQLGGLGPFTSKDIDFQGARNSVLTCAGLLKEFQAEALLPRIDDSTPSSGLVKYVDSSGAEREIDFLTSVFGLDGGEVLERSRREFVTTLSGGEFCVRVMHPFHCMQSRVFNVVGLPGQYNNDHGLRQLRASIACLRAMIEQVAKDNPRDALKLIKRVFRFAKHRRARRLRATHEISVFDAVPVSPHLPNAFHETEYPRMRRSLGLAPLPDLRARVLV
jgi:hypothetical protein